MAEQQKIHPVDLESAKPTTPLFPPTSPRSHTFNPSGPPTRPARSQTRPPKTHTLNFFCCTLLTLTIFLIAVASSAGILYLIYRPKLPSYSVDRLSITSFEIDPNLTAHAGFELTVTAKNPNKKIGIYYESGSWIRVLYDETVLCVGSFPVFYQGHRNETTVKTALIGKARLENQIISALRQQQETGNIPLTFRGDVPFKLRIGGLKLWKVKAKVRCDLVVSSLSVGSFISLKTSNCKFRLKL